VAGGVQLAPDRELNRMVGPDLRHSTEDPTTSHPGPGTTRVPADLLGHLRAARDLIDRRYADKLDLDRLARRAGVSKYHFLRCFAASYGLTPSQYLSRRRIERAQDLLRATNLTVSEVCRLVGYDSLGSFSSRFSALVGQSPSAYQRRWAEAGGPMIPGCFLFMIGLQDRQPVPADSAIPEKR
jgi:AraC-like DNA-binding protein